GEQQEAERARTGEELPAPNRCARRGEVEHRVGSVADARIDHAAVPRERGPDRVAELEERERDDDARRDPAGTRPQAPGAGTGGRTVGAGARASTRSLRRRSGRSTSSQLAVAVASVSPSARTKTVSVRGSRIQSNPPQVCSCAIHS